MALIKQIDLSTLDTNRRDLSKQSYSSSAYLHKIGKAYHNGDDQEQEVENFRESKYLRLSAQISEAMSRLADDKQESSIHRLGSSTRAGTTTPCSTRRKIDFASSANQL